MLFKKKYFSLAGLKKVLLGLAIASVLIILSFVIFYLWASSGSLPKDKLSRVIVYSDWEHRAYEKRESFTIMTYNIGYLAAMFNNLPVKTEKELFEKNMNRFLQMLKEVRPDVINFQEIDFNSSRSYYINQLRVIAEEASYNYGAVAVNWDKHYVPFPYWPPSVQFGRILSGQAVLSNWPILSADRVVLQRPQNIPFYINAFYLDRLAQVVKLKIGDSELIILNVHVEAYSKETREKQAQNILEIYRSYKDEYPVLLLGDFNCVPPKEVQKNDFPNEKTITLFLQEVGLRAADLTINTFPSVKPTRKLDYIFYTHDKISMLNAFAVEIDSSDHLPLVMQFQIMKLDKKPII